MSYKKQKMTEVFDDITIKSELNEAFTQVCAKCNTRLELNATDQSVIRGTICGASGCQEEADFFLELPSGLGDYLGREADKVCFRCDSRLYKEFGDISAKYPFVCLECDENMYNFEAVAA